MQHSGGALLGSLCRRGVAGSALARWGDEDKWLSSPSSQGPLSEGSGTTDLALVPTMKSPNLRRLAEAAATEGADPQVWAAIAARAAESAEKLNYWDTVMILQAFTAARVENRPLFLRLGDALSSKTSRLAPKHVLDLFAVYEAHGLRPRTLYVELFHTVIRLSRSMHAEELSLTLQALARYRLGNPTVLVHMVRTVLQQLKDCRLRYLCGITGALAAMETCPAALLEPLDTHARLELDSVPVQELLDDLQSFGLLEFSWKPYEDLCREELLTRTRAFYYAEDMDQFADPFKTMRWFQSNGLLHTEFLETLCQWCLAGVHRPNVRSERRPTARQLVALHDLCYERGLEDTVALQDTLQYYVESVGGKYEAIMPRALKYRKFRKYFRSADPHEGLLPVGVGYGSSVGISQRPDVQDLPGLPASSDEASWMYEEEPSELAVQDQATGAAPRKRKLSARSPLLAPEESLVYCWTGSRKSPRPRHRRDPGLKKMLRKDMPRLPLWAIGGWTTRPKYQTGTAFWGSPYKGYPRTSRSGAAAVLRH